MSDWNDVIRERREADSARMNAAGYGSQIEEGDRTGDAAFATLLASEAICAEIRALSCLLDYSASLERAR